MSDKGIRCIWLISGVGCAILTGTPAFADDTELFIGTSVDPSARPNILFILDNSRSMETAIETQPPYNPEQIYTGSCSATRVYWRSGTGDPPLCTTNNWFNRSSLVCDRAMQAFIAGAGRYTDAMAQYDNAVNNAWQGVAADQKTRLVECQDDSGWHGDGTSASLVYAQNGFADALWSSSSADEVGWGNAPINNIYSVYDGNFLNWYYGPTVTSTRLEVLKEVTKGLLNSINGVNVGLMQFNESEGGPVVVAVDDIENSRPEMIAAIDAMYPYQQTPLSETLYEAGLYFRGANVDYGNLQDPPHSVDSARTAPGSNTYKSPVLSQCQKNIIVLLTDGQPESDGSANSKIVAQPGFSTLVGSACDGSGGGHCLDDAAEYLYKLDVNRDLPGTQNVVTHTVGFTLDLPLLRETADAGGGQYFTADDSASLSSVFTNIVTSIIDTKSTFSAPTVAVNSFNRTRNLNDIFVSVFQPTGTTHWPGNVKRYRIDPATGGIVDADGNPAVDAGSGFFADTARSFWSAEVDGSDVMSGGAANALPDPSARRIYTYLASASLTNPNNEVDVSNALIDNALLGIGFPGDPTREDVIAHARGVDVTDEDLDGDRAEPRNAMGDPLHSQPTLVMYGGTPASPDVTDAVVYIGTNDGYLHAIDPETGAEKWAFIPPEFLPDLAELYANDATSYRHYGIDGEITVQLDLVDNDGVIDPSAGEKAYLYFGMRRGGSMYYALDVTYPDSPTVLWKLDSSDLPGVGQTWSTPIPTRIAIGDGSSQNADRLVLVFGGGYDATQDDLTGTTDVVGNSIYIVDSVTGELLWHASNSGADRNLPMMNYSIPGDIRVVDLDSDHFADRMYAADMGGQVWRFDIFHGQDPASLVNGGVIAQLGGAPVDPSDPLETRRFYYAPDVALVSDQGSTFLHIGVGSGHRAHPNSVAAQDRFYALRDYLPFGTRTQAVYDALAESPVTDSDLVDITDNVDATLPAGSPGWRFELRLNDAWSGEKVLAEARTFNNQIFFTTFTPSASSASTDCFPNLGTNRLYVMDILAGRPVTNLDQSADEEVLTESDRYVEFNGSLPTEVVFLFPSPEDENCVGAECTPPPLACVGLFCFPPDFANNPVRTFWSQEPTY